MVVVENTFKLQVEASARLLSIMSNSSRIQILRLLTQKEWDVSSLAQHVNLSQSALSQHLKKMRDAKLVEWRQQAQTRYYYCQSNAVLKILDAIADLSHVHHDGASGADGPHRLLLSEEVHLAEAISCTLSL